MISIEITATISDQTVHDLLITALESGVTWISKYTYQQKPFSLWLQDMEGDTHNLDHEDLHNSLQRLADYYPHHINDILNENDDIITADSFLQMAVYRDIIYG